MPTYKCDFTFLVRDRGWTETWYRQEADSAAAMNATKLLAPVRLTLCGRLVAITALRVSDVAIFSDSRVDYEERRGTFPGDETAPDQANACWLTMASAGPRHRRQFFLRGMPDKQIEVDIASGAFFLSDAMRGRINGMQGALVNSSWRLRVWNLTGASFQPFRISNVSANVGGIFQVTNFGGNFQPLERVHIKGVKGEGATTVNGMFSVFSTVDASNFTLNIPVPAGGIFYESGGTVRRQEYTYEIVTSLQPIRVATRLTGGPRDTPKARRKRRPLSN